MFQCWDIRCSCVLFLFVCVFLYFIIFIVVVAVVVVVVVVYVYILQMFSWYYLPLTCFLVGWVQNSHRVEALLNANKYSNKKKKKIQQNENTNKTIKITTTTITTSNNNFMFYTFINLSTWVLFCFLKYISVWFFYSMYPTSGINGYLTILLEHKMHTNIHCIG